MDLKGSEDPRGERAGERGYGDGSEKPGVLDGPGLTCRHPD